MPPDPTPARSAPPRDPVVLSLEILPQPDDDSCGPTCLQAVYRYWGDTIELDALLPSVTSLSCSEAGRGTLAVMLGIHALSRGYRATLYTFNLQIFDPTWFDAHGKAKAEHLTDRLQLQAAAKSLDDPRFRVASNSYLTFLKQGGLIRYRDLSSTLIAGFVRKGIPILTGLSATYLYRCAREYGPQDEYDDIRGLPTGHFVVLHGYDPRGRRVTVADPLANNPGFDSQRYTVTMARLVPAIMLGVLTYDANLLVIEPASSADGAAAP